jgi:hypothetical protein
MPFAGIGNTTERHDLKSLEGAFVVLRRMTYGEKLGRQDLTKLSIEMGGKSKDLKGEMAMANKRATQMDFANCVVDHNLEKDDVGTKFNLTVFDDFAKLDPRVGEEIDTLINKMNNFEDSDSGNE